MRAVANTAGNLSVADREREDARSVSATMREAVAVLLVCGSDGVDILTSDTECRSEEAV